jgi:MFS family permease
MSLTQSSSSTITRYHWWAFLACWLGGVFDGMDSTLMSVVLPVAIGDLTGNPDPAAIAGTGSVVNCLFLLGWTVGGILFGWVGDRYGRLKSMMISILLYSLFTGLAGLSQDWTHLAACRFLTGLGIGGELVSIATFLTEVWPAASRAVAVAALITSYQAGVFLAGLLHFGVPDWRWTFGVGALPALLVVLLRLTLKESDRWEAAHQQEPARLQDHAKPLWIGALAFAGLLVGYWASLSWVPTWIHQLPGTPESARSLATMALAVGAVGGCLLAGPMCQTLGRRWTLMLSSVGCWGASVWLFGSHTQFSPAIYGHNALLGLATGLTQAALYVYLPELFPTRIRATATGFCLNAGRIVTAGAVLVSGVLVTALGGLGSAATAFALSYLVTVLAVLLGPETRHRPLLD